MTQTMTTATPKAFPRQQIAEAICDLQAVRGKIGDLQIAGYGLLNGFPDAPADVREDLKSALEAIDRAHKVTQDSIRALYAQPTAQIANDDREEAA